ncbi:MAG: hypothetical protein AAF333_15760 [Planctomycetota bacterium]
MNRLRPWMMLAVTTALLCGSAPFAVTQPGPDDERTPRHPERNRERGVDRDLHEPGGERPGRRQPMTADEIESARRIIAQLYPELAERMDTLYEENPEKLRRTIETRFPRVRFLVKLKERDPAMFDLRLSDIRLGRETLALARQVKKAHVDDDKDKYKMLYAELEAKLAEHFDVKQQVRQAELDFFRQRVEQLEDELEDRDDDRDDLIEQRLNELVGPEW